MNKHYSSTEFEKKFTYHGTDLGAFWTKEKTCFRVWAPTAESVAVNLYAGGTAGTDDLTAQIPMVSDVCGTWSAVVNGDLNGVYYTYLVTVDGIVTEACDPYARTTGVNGHRAMVIDLASKPGGVDLTAAGELGRTVIWALSLPGKVAPVTAGSAIKQTIYTMLRELGPQRPGKEGIP